MTLKALQRLTGKYEINAIAIVVTLENMISRKDLRCCVFCRKAVTFSTGDQGGIADDLAY
jgi:hypothetical protein